MSDKAECIFLLTDLDYKIKETDTSPTIRLFGKTKHKSIQVRINDFYPYFFITQKEGLEDFINNNKRIKNWLHQVEKTTGKRYFGGEDIELIKISGTHPEQTPKIRQIFVDEGYEIHEADIPFLKRFLIDTKVRSLNVTKLTGIKTLEDESSILFEANYHDIETISQKERLPADYFYKLKI